MGVLRTRILNRKSGNKEIPVLNRMFASAVALLAATTAAVATPITFTGTDGSRAASALFAASGTDLIVTLTNTWTADAMVPTDVLTGVFFDIDIAGNPALGRTSAVLNSGSTVLFGGSDAGGVVGGEWAYKNSLSVASGVGTQGISSSGLGLFGPGDRFPGTDLQGPPSGSVDGLQYGLTTAGDDPTTGNTPMTGTNALIKNSVVFTLGGLPTGFDPSSSVSKVYFQYGTALDEPRFSGDLPPPVGGAVPEPMTLLAILSALGSVGAYVRRRLA
jgi:hypothetical protein